MNWMIRTAEPADASALPQLESSAGRRFLTIPHLAWIADAQCMPVDAHRRYIALGSEWVALSESGELVGFLAAEAILRDLHIWELAVRTDVQSKRIGTSLIAAAAAFAREGRLRSLTLTTFADVPWNAPWYSRIGFEMATGDERLGCLVRAETARGWPGRCAMRKTIEPAGLPVVTEGEAPDVEAFLADRIYEYNAQATGYRDGKSFSATRRDESGSICAGVNGYTWGGCSYISPLWVRESERGRGLGAAFLQAAEEYAQTKGCRLVLLATHSFQAPGFYEYMGYEKRTAVRDHPIGHASIILAKRLWQRASAKAEFRPIKWRVFKPGLNAVFSDAWCCAV